jgi:hypothetical protein
MIAEWSPNCKSHANIVGAIISQFCRGSVCQARAVSRGGRLTVPSALLDATTELHKVLEPLSSEERQKAIKAVMVLFGESAPSASSEGKREEKRGPEGQPGVSAAARSWMQKNQITEELLSSHIHMDGGTATVIELPSAKSGKGKTIATYLMAGLAGLFSAGEPSFSDESARVLCVHFGCYDHKNHSKYIKSLGNNVTGSKSAGWKLTAPGLTSVANRLKGQESSD